MSLSVSVVMPALNEEPNIKRAIETSLDAFNKLQLDGEIIVINDGSEDQTEEIIREITKQEQRIKIINHQSPQGIGFSFIDGVRQATKDVVVMFPGDGENDPLNALRFVDLMDRVDILVPFIHNIEVRNKVRRILSSVYRMIINISFGINLNYTNGTVFYRRSILEGVNIHSRGFFYQAEILIRLIRKGYFYAEVPNVLAERVGDKSKAVTLKSLFDVIWCYTRMAWVIHVLRIEDRKNYKKLSSDSITFQNFKVL